MIKIEQKTLCVNSFFEAESLARDLLDWSLVHPIGVDTETENCNPKKQSPIHSAEMFCLSFAWGVPKQATPSPFNRAFVLTEYLPAFEDLLASHRHQKVGTNLFSFDRHVFANHGVKLRGIVGDTLLMSRLLNPSKDKGHGLKPWGERLGYTVRSFESLASRRVCTGQTIYKRTQTRHKPWPVHYTAGAEAWTFGAGTELVPLSKLWRDYEHKRQELIDYACQDAAMSLDVYHYLRRME